jgi:hypothetical protein
MTYGLVDGWCLWETHCLTLKKEAAGWIECWWYLSTKLHGVTSLKSIILIFTAVGTSDLTQTWANCFANHSLCSRSKTVTETGNFLTLFLRHPYISALQNKQVLQVLLLLQSVLIIWIRYCLFLCPECLLWISNLPVQYHMSLSNLLTTFSFRTFLKLHFVWNASFTFIFIKTSVRGPEHEAGPSCKPPSHYTWIQE